MRQLHIEPVFVSLIPEQLVAGKLYVSEEHRIALHLCCCGCGEEVVTPLSPAQWQLTVRGRRVSLTPSVGNWNSPCRSHYWIHENAVKWAGSLSERDIARVKAKDRRDLARQIAKTNERRQTSSHADDDGRSDVGRFASRAHSLWSVVKRWVLGR